MTWNEITLKQYLEIQNIYSKQLTDLERAALLLKVVLGKDIEEIPIAEIEPYIAEVTALLNSEMPKGSIKKKYTINNNTYILSPAIEDMTTSQFWDFTEYSKDASNIANVLACFLIPKGKKYGEDREIVLADMEQLSIVDVNCIAFFFTQQVKRIVENYTGLFNSGNGEGDDLEEEASNAEAPLQGMQKYGLLNYVLKAVEVTNHSLTEVLELPICTVLTIVQWSIDKAKMEEQQIRKMQQKWK